MEVPRAPLLVAPAPAAARWRQQADPSDTPSQQLSRQTARNKLAAYLRGGVADEASSIGDVGRQGLDSTPGAQAQQLGPGLCTAPWPWETAFVAMRPVGVDFSGDLPGALLLRSPERLDPHRGSTTRAAAALLHHSAGDTGATRSLLGYYADRIDGTAAAGSSRDKRHPAPLHEQLVRLPKRPPKRPPLPPPLLTPRLPHTKGL